MHTFVPPPSLRPLCTLRSATLLCSHRSLVPPPHALSQAQRDSKKSRFLLVLSYLIILFLIAANIASVVLLVLFKDTYAVGSGTSTNLGITKSHPTVSDSHGNVMLTGTATNTLPLYVAPVLSDEELISVGKIHVRVPNSEFALNVVSFFTIARLDKVNSTVLIFHALGGEQIRIVNGVTTIRLSPTSIDFPICSESVSCAAFEVDNPMLAEKYMAKAEAVLAPFAYAKNSHEAACEACGQAGLLQRWVGAAYEGSLNCQQAFEANADEIRKDADSSCLKDLMKAGLPAPKGFTDASSITCADLNDQMIHAQASAWETLDCAGDTESLGGLDEVYRPCTSAAARTFSHREGRVCIHPLGAWAALAYLCLPEWCVVAPDGRFKHSGTVPSAATAAASSLRFARSLAPASRARTAMPLAACKPWRWTRHSMPTRYSTRHSTPGSKIIAMLPTICGPGAAGPQIVACLMTNARRRVSGVVGPGHLPSP